MGWRGHYWTIWPTLKGQRTTFEVPAWRPFVAHAPDPERGPVPLSGKLSIADPSRLLVLVHGLGGCTESIYLQRMAEACGRAGISSLRLDMRGSDRQGHDIYHAGLSSDLAVVLASPALAEFDRISVVGYSVGGHVTLRYATEVEDPRVRSVAAVCSPLHLATTVAHFDEPHRYIYRRYILNGLRDLYRNVHARAEQEGRELPRSLEQVMSVRGLREWDAHTVVPRFGFRDTDDYYAFASVGPRLKDLRVPSLLVASEWDPMVTAASIRAGFEAWAPGSDASGASLADAGLDVRWVEKGGHVGFPAGFDLGEVADPGLESQLLSWLARH